VWKSYFAVYAEQDQTLSVVVDSPNQEQFNIEHYAFGVSPKQAITGTIIFKVGVHHKAYS